MSHEEVDVRKNRMLAALPNDELERLAPRLERVPMPVRREVTRPGEPVTHVHFPIVGSVSMTAIMYNGAQVEVGLVGAEGVAGHQEALAEVPAVNYGYSQIAGESLRIEAAAFREAFAASGALARFVYRYQHAYSTQISQSAACNRLHAVELRLARWLLMSHDRAGSDDLRLTHEFLSTMLAAHRPVVTRAVGALVSEGVITQQRGTITVRDRTGLEALACECYEIVTAVFDAIYGDTA